MLDWLKRLYQDIQGNLKYDLLKTIGGGGMIAAAEWCIHRITHVDAVWLEFSGIFLFSALIFFVGLVGSSKRVIVVQRPEVSAVPALEVNPIPSIPVHKLRIEVLNGFVGRWTDDAGAFGFSELRVLLILRVAPTTDPGVSVKSWSIEYSDCHSTDYWGKATIEPIPDYLEYAATLSGDINDKPKRTVPAIAPLTYSHKIPYGTHSEGALWVTVYGDNIHDFFRYSFIVKATDSLDGESECFKGPGDWLRPAQFSIGNPPASIVPLYLGPPLRFE